MFILPVRAMKRKSAKAPPLLWRGGGWKACFPDGGVPLSCPTCRGGVCLPNALNYKCFAALNMTHCACDVAKHLFVIL